jgi:superfamily II DNA or RNA helicase
MDNEKDYILYELQCIKYHQEIYGQQSWHWTQIPENVLFESGFIHDGNEYRLKRKLKWQENQEYFNPLQEYGLDGIALEICGDKKIYHGIQCKLWKNKLSGNDLGTFFICILARLNKKNQESKGYLYHSGPLEINLKNDLSQIPNIITTIKLEYNKQNDNNEDEEIILYDFQKEAVKKLDDNWNNIGYLILPCGTGKTIIFSEHLKNQKYKNIIIVSPLRIQVKQTLKRVKKYIPNYYSILLDSDIEGSNDFQEIENNWNENLLISTTFKSFQDILIQLFYQEKENDILKLKFDLSETILIIDEAHNIINLKKIIQMIESFPKVLLVTATPPSIMEELIVGNIIYQYSMQKAIENHYICDYEIYLPLLDEKNNSEFYIKIPEEIKIEEENELLYKKAIFLIEGLIQTGSNNCIVYLSDIESCSIFNKVIIELINNYYYFPYWIGTIDCNTSSTEREELLKKFQDKVLKSEIKILLSIRILDEGIDIPKCDSIFITSVGDYSNDIRMIQRLCRAVRIDKINLSKKANCFIWTDNMNKVNRSLKILKENDINFIGKINNKKLLEKSNIVNDITNKSIIFENKLENKNNQNNLVNKKYNKILYICENCEKEFIDKYHYERHKNNKKKCKTNENKKLKCDYCSKFFSSKKTLDRHQKEGYCNNYNKLITDNNKKFEDIIKYISNNNENDKLKNIEYLKKICNLKNS